MNTAPKLPDQLLAWNVRNALGPYNDDDMPLIDLIIQLRNKLAALAPPSGEGVEPDAWMRDSGISTEDEPAAITKRIKELWLSVNPSRVERYTIPLYLHPPVAVDDMVNRFLCWPLPNDFAPDAGISFNPGPTQYMPHCWPVGTNLFTADQAKAMFLHCIATPQSAPVDGDAVQQALLVINDAENDARHRGDYARANALVKARVTLYRASATPPPASQERGGLRWPSSLGIAAIAREIWGNPIPPEAYAFAKRLHSAASPPSSAADGECPKCGAPTDPDWGHIGDCRDAAEQAKPDGDDKWYWRLRRY